MAEAEGRPRVLHVGPDPDGGGGMAAVTRALLASPLARRYRLEAVATYRTAAPVRRLVVYCLALLRLSAWSIRRRGLVHVHATVRGSMYRKSVCVVLARALGRRVVLQIHSGPGDIAEFRAGLRRPSRTLFAAALRSSNVVLAVSSASAAALERAYGVGGVRVVPNAAPLVRDRVGAHDGDPPTLLYMGGFANAAKGGDVLLDSLELALARTRGLRVVLAGPGELPAAGCALVDREPRVEWRGWLDRSAKEAALEEADVFVLASRSEGLPVALLEAMAHGLPIVATTVGGVPDVLDADRDALLVPAGAPEGLADALVRISGDRDLRDRLGAAARERARELSEDAVADRLDAVYAELL